MVANAGLSEDSFKAAQKSAKEAFFDLLKQFRPWEGDNEQRKGDEISRLRALYVKTYGDPSDPVWAAEHKQKMDTWLASRKKMRETESDEQRVNRLLREREQTRKEKIRKMRVQ